MRNYFVFLFAMIFLLFAIIGLAKFAQADESKTDLTDANTYCVRINRGGQISYACFPRDNRTNQQTSN